MPLFALAKITLPLFLMLGILMGCHAPADPPNGGAVLWEKPLVKASETDRVYAIRSQPDGSLEADGTNILSNVDKGAFTLLLSGNGDITDRKIIEQPHRDPFRSSLYKPQSIGTKDGGRLYYKPVRHEKYAVYRLELTRKDANDKVLWQRTFEGSETDKGLQGLYGFAVLEQDNGDIIIVGHEGSTMKLTKVYFKRLDADGNVLWHSLADQDIYPVKQGADRITNVIQLENGDIAALGYHNFHRNVMNRNSMPLLVHISARGQNVTRKTFFNSGQNAKGFVHLSKQIDGSYLLIGSDFIMKTNSNFDPIWKKSVQLAKPLKPHLENEDEGPTHVLIRQAGELKNGNIIISGMTGSIQNKNHETFIAMFDPEGLPLWFRHYPKQSRKVIWDMLILEDDLGAQALMLLGDLSKSRSSILMKVDLSTPPVDAYGDPVGTDSDMMKTTEESVDPYFTQDIVEKRDDLTNYNAVLTIREETGDELKQLCKALYDALPRQHQDLFIDNPHVTYKAYARVPWGNKVPNIGAILDDLIPERETLKWTQITEPTDNRNIHSLLGNYLGQQYYKHDGSLETARYNNRTKHWNHDLYIAKYDEAPPNPSEFYQIYKVKNTPYTFYPGAEPDYPSVNTLRIYFDGKNVQSYERIQSLETAFYLDGKIISQSYGGLTVFDPAIAPDENPYIRHHSGNHRIVASGPFREDQGCNIKFSAREAAAN